MFIKTKELADYLHIKPVTLRKYAEVMEKAGYIVYRSDNGRREYSENDAMVFKQLQTLCKRSGMTLESAANVIVSRKKSEYVSIADEEELPSKTENERYAKRYDEAISFLKVLVENNERYTEEIAELRKQMDQQNQLFSAVLQEFKETKSLVAATSDRKWWNFIRRKSN
ncbi:hypothetical protein D1872_171510 [compost metagenome]